MECKANVMSETRRIYFMRLIGRILLFFVTIYVYVFDKEEFNIAKDMNFFNHISWLHFIWLLWVFDMIIQLIPVKAHISVGSQKVFQSVFRPIKEKINRENLIKYIKDTTFLAYKVMIIWILVTLIISILYRAGIIDAGKMVLISMFFYVCDLICVLVWCPFRYMMKNKCCTTCRIFNWDHLMMFLPIVTLNSFYSWTLVIFSFSIWLIWEICVFTYPERFWEHSNMALKCSECTDKLCTQYCRKLRNK